MLILFFAMLLTQKRSLFTVAYYKFLGLSCRVYATSHRFW